MILGVRNGESGDLRRAIGRELRESRRQRSLTQRQLASPLTGAYVSSIEAGRVFPSVPALAHLLGRLGVDLGVFFSRVDASMAKETADERNSSGRVDSEDVRGSSSEASPCGRH